MNDVMTKSLKECGSSCCKDLFRCW